MPDHVKRAISVARKAIDDDAAMANINPTKRQIESGNYRKSKLRLHGLDISIENPKGSTRSGTSKDGKAWIVVSPAHYGYVRGHESADGDNVDCYVGPDPHSDRVWIVDQVDATTGKFDEHKIMLGFSSGDAAFNAYQKAFSDGKGRERIGAFTAMSIGELKHWLKNGDTTKPIGVVKRADGGKVDAADITHHGPLLGPTPGRADHILTSVKGGSYILPADHVSALGQGNTNAGFSVLNHMFKRAMPAKMPSVKFSDGGEAHEESSTVPVKLSDGEYAITPEEIIRRFGDLKDGHKALDAWVKATRAEHIKQLKSLPPPAK